MLSFVQRSNHLLTRFVLITNMKPAAGNAFHEADFTEDIPPSFGASEGCTILRMYSCASYLKGELRSSNSSNVDLLESNRCRVFPRSSSIAA